MAGSSVTQKPTPAVHAGQPTGKVPMASITKAELELLIQLQDAELEAGRISAWLEQLPGQIQALDEELSNAYDAVREKKNNLEILKKDYRKLESDFETGQARIKKRKTQLDGVKSNKDYQALLKEIEDIRMAGSRMEDEMLGLLDAIDAAEAEVTEAERLHAGQKAAVEEKKRELEESGASRRERLEELRESASIISEMLDLNLKKRYRKIRDQSGGLAVVSVEDAVCRGCHLNIPPQMYNELHHGNELRYCPHCYRMIYVL